MRCATAWSFFDKDIFLSESASFDNIFNHAYCGEHHQNLTFQMFPKLISQVGSRKSLLAPSNVLLLAMHDWLLNEISRVKVFCNYCLGLHIQEITKFKFICVSTIKPVLTPLCKFCNFLTATLSWVEFIPPWWRVSEKCHACHNLLRCQLVWIFLHLLESFHQV